MLTLLLLIAQTGGLSIVPSAPGDSTPFVVRIEVEGLEPNTEYGCGLWVYGKPAAVSRVWTDDRWIGGYRYTSFTSDTSGRWVSYRVLKIVREPAQGFDYYIRCVIRDGDKNRVLESTIRHSDGFEIIEDIGYIEGIVYSDSTMRTPLEKTLIFARDEKGKVLGGYISERNRIEDGYRRKKGYFRLGLPPGTVSSIMIISNEEVLGTFEGNWNIEIGETLDIGSIFP